MTTRARSPIRPGAATVRRRRRADGSAEALADSVAGRDRAAARRASNVGLPSMAAPRSGSAGCRSAIAPAISPIGCAAKRRRARARLLGAAAAALRGRRCEGLLPGSRLPPEPASRRAASSATGSGTRLRRARRSVRCVRCCLASEDERLKLIAGSSQDHGPRRAQCVKRAATQATLLRLGAGGTCMIRAAIVGIGRWGRTLVGAVQGKSDAIRFTGGYNRTRAHAEAFCAEHGIALQRQPRRDPRRPGDRCGRIRDAAQRARGPGRARRRGRQARLHGKAVHARPAAAPARRSTRWRAPGSCSASPIRAAFIPGMRELKARIDDGRLGTIAHCHAEQNSPAGLFMDPQSWRADPQEAPAGGMTAIGRPQSRCDDPPVRPDRGGLCDKPAPRRRL